jgi:hypothetical protein
VDDFRKHIVAWSLGLFTLGLGLHLTVAVAVADAPARDATTHRIENLFPALAQQSNRQETLRGVITALDERADRMTVRLDSASETHFKVQDGLLFNAAHAGDRVEIAVETIGGTKTIVALKKL